MSIRKEDIQDLDIVDSFELASDGYAVYLTTTLVSTDFSLQKIIINAPSDGEGILYSLDHPAEAGDRVRLVGTSGGSADGYYIINSILDDLSFTITTSINSSTGGTIYFMHPAGAYRVGFNSTGLSSTNSNNLQDAIKDIGYAVDNSINLNQHESLRQLIHFINSGPANGFGSQAFKKILPIPSLFPTSIIWYLDVGLTLKLIEKIIVWDGVVPKTITWNMYASDGSTIIHTIIDTFTYQNTIFESLVTRNIS